MFLFLFVLSVIARYIVIAPKATLTFLESVDKDTIYKFIYSTKSNVSVLITDPLGHEIVKTTNNSVTIYTQASDKGYMTMSIKNLDNSRCEFAYKCPDTNKELSGHVGYVKETDLVGELARALDELVANQKKLIDRTVDHQKMVSRSRSLANLLMIFEFLLTAFVVYMLHKDFIAMFETKQTL
ncbi:hypothetical protein PAEPH01_1878 [Pancytospora epiphaga]|nr:hypothetical protein PAEPH01_1878 [Pancytospora epiphaga]